MYVVLQVVSTSIGATVKHKGTRLGVHSVTVDEAVTRRHQNLSWKQLIKPFVTVQAQGLLTPEYPRYLEVSSYSIQFILPVSKTKTPPHAKHVGANSICAKHLRIAHSPLGESHQL
jgi:hypothetical protein